MRKRIQTTIEEKALKELDIKIAYSDFFQDRNSYIEFLIRFLPFIPIDIRKDDDISDVLKKMYANLGAGTPEPTMAQKIKNEKTQVKNDEDQIIINMAKDFKLKTQNQG
jgi:hypothetical protein